MTGTLTKKIHVTVLKGSFAGHQGVCIHPLARVCIHLQDLGLQFESTQWTAKLSNTRLSKKCKKRQKRARRTSGQASDRMGREKHDKIAGPGLNNVGDRNETSIIAYQSSQEGYKRPTLSHPKMIPTLTPTLKILLHQTCYPVSP